MSERLALYLLGPPGVELDRATVSIDRRKTLALLAYLAVNRWQHHRDHISALFWPEYAQPKAFSNLRHILWEVQQIIGDGWIIAGRDTVGLIAEGAGQPNGRVVWLDVARFDSLITESRLQKDSSLRVQLLAESVKLYRDHFLTGFSLKNSPHFNEWAFAESDKLRHQLAGALTMLTDDYCSLGQAENAIPHARRLITLDPLNEDSHRQLMQVYISAGQPNAALKQYQTCEQILRKELGVDPQPDTRLLYKQIRKGDTIPLRPVKRKEARIAPQHNLPFQISRFIGREKELAEVAGLIKGYRLVSLVGTGGIGKTRLSLKLGEQILNDYADGIWLVELASLSDPALVPQTVAKLFNLGEQAQESLTDKLIRVLYSKTILLLLDNCEHLLDACAQLADTLLRSCPDLKILTTSREPLGITGEAQYHVPPLELPDLQQMLERLLDYESIQLFAERARLVQEHFSLNMENAPSIARICHRLDGIPLAIELAAARVNLLSPQEIAERLDASFNLLTAGSRTALPRQQTIRASIDWSWNLLSESEQTLLRRLSIFSGGWTLDGAEAVGDRAKVLDVPGLLASLSEKSLVLLFREHEHYRILETVREYALERLKDANEEEMTRNRHLDFYVEMAERAEPGLLGREQGFWMKKLGEEQENIISANEWCALDTSRTEKRFCLLGGTRYFWVYAGLSKLGFKIFSEALAASTGGVATLARGLTHDGAAIYANLLGHPSLSEHAEESISIFQSYNDDVRLAMALTRKALGYVHRGDHAQAIRVYREAIAAGRRTEDKRPISSALNNLAELYRMDGEYDKAAPLYEEALAIDREREDSTGIVLGLGNLSRNALMQGNRDNLRAQLVEAISIAEDMNLREYAQFIIEAAGILRFLLGEYLEGVLLFGAAAAELKKKEQADPPDEKFTAYWMNQMCETMGEAAFSDALKEGGRLSYEDALAKTRKWLEKGPQ